MRFLALLALSLPSTALAGTRVDKFLGRVKEVTLDGAIEVPLLSAPYGEELPCVFVRYGEDDELGGLFLLDLGGTGIAVIKGVAEEHGDGVHLRNKKFFRSLGLKEEKAEFRDGGKYEVTHLDEIRVGDLVLSGVTASVQQINPAPGYFSAPGPADIAGVIGLGALGLAASIEPSRGVVRFAPADQGEALLQGVGGTVVPFRSTEGEFVKTWQGRTYFPPRHALLEGTVGGEAVGLQVATSFFGSRLDRDLPAGDGPKYPVGEVEAVWTAAQVGGVTLGPEWMAQFDLTAADHPAGKEGMLAYDVWRDYDLALDPGTAQFAFRPATAQQRKPSLQGFIDAKAKKIAEIDAPDEDGAPREKTEEELKADTEKRAGLLAEKGELELLAAQTAAGIADIEQATSLDADPCQYWLDLRWAYSEAGRFEEAAVAAQKALDRYAAWAALTMDERETIEEMEDEEREASGVQPQDLDACHGAAARVAYYELVAGKLAEAEAVWTEQQDLHPGLGVVAGVAYLLEGQPDKAQGPLRHALNRAAPSGIEHEGYAMSARIGLAEAYRQSGDLATALGHWDKERRFLNGDPFAVQQYADLVRAARGDAAALEALRSLAADTPANAVVRTVLGRELAAAGQEAEARAAFAEAAALYARFGAYRLTSDGWHAALSWHHVLAGDPAAAKREAEAALGFDPSSAYAHWTLMKLAEADGNVGEAVARWKLARAHAMGHWAFASLPEPKVVVKARIKPIQVTETAIVIGDKVFFETGKAVILPESFELLDAVAKVLTEHPELLRVSVEGHTDSDGDDRQNLDLSQARAQAVLEHLVGKGIAAERLAAKGWGEKKPIGDNATDEGKDQNRRVEFVILKKK